MMSAVVWLSVIVAIIILGINLAVMLWCNFDSQIIITYIALELVLGALVGVFIGSFWWSGWALVLCALLGTLLVAILAPIIYVVVVGLASREEHT
jgi:hypothetical protein